MTQTLVARLFIAMGGILGFLAVGLGAFGAHALKDRLSPQMMATFETASRYHLVHAAMIVVVGLLCTQRASNWAVLTAGWSFVVGIVLFSGSLYLLALTNVRWLGAITPLGGVAFLAGWLTLAAGQIFWSP